MAKKLKKEEAVVVDKSKIFVTPAKEDTICFEGTRAKIPKEGDCVKKSIYYIRLINEGSLKLTENKEKGSK